MKTKLFILSLVFSLIVIFLSYSIYAGDYQEATSNINAGDCKMNNEKSFSDELWSINPGAYELQLKRRINSPYFFSTYQQAVSEGELDEAIRIDNEDYALVEQRIPELTQELEAFNSTMSSGDLIRIRKRLEETIQIALGVGGRGNEVASTAGALREIIIEQLKQTFSNDQENLAAIEKADNYYKQNEAVFRIPIVAQLQRKRSPIKDDETIATILSQDAKTISLVMNIFKDQTRLIIGQEAIKLLSRAHASECIEILKIDSEFLDKLSIFENLSDN